MNRTKWIVAGVVAVVILFVVLQNTQTIVTRILWMKLSMPLAALLLTTFLVGCGFGAAMAAWSRQRRR